MSIGPFRPCLPPRISKGSTESKLFFNLLQFSSILPQWRKGLPTKKHVRMKPAPSPPALNLRLDPSPIQKQRSTRKRVSNHTISFYSSRLLTVLFTASLEDAIQNALRNYLPRLESAGGSARAQFYNEFKREADEYDNDFLGKYRGDLDTTLIFVGLPPLSCRGV